MTKKQQKWIAWLVTLTFVWLLQVSAGPLAAAGASEKIDSTTNEQGPGFLEAAGNKVAPVTKKSILPYVLIGVGVAAAAAVLFLVVLKTNYDISGEWMMNFSVPGSPAVSGLMTFSDKKSGATALNTTPGDYVVDGKNVTINLRKTMYEIPYHWEFIGEFKTKDRIEGDFKFYENEVYKPQYDTTFSLDRN